jgi:hypothetical protein
MINSLNIIVLIIIGYLYQFSCHMNQAFLYNPIRRVVNG